MLKYYSRTHWLHNISFSRRACIVWTETLIFVSVAGRSTAKPLQQCHYCEVNSYWITACTGEPVTEGESEGVRG